MTQAPHPIPSPIAGTPEQKRAQPLDIALLVTLGAIWGASFTAIKVAVTTIPPMTLAAGRIAIGAVALVIAARLMGKALPRDPRVLGLLFLTALFNCALPFFLIGWGEQTVDSALAALLMGAGPVIAAILAHLTTADEQVTPLKLMGVLMGLGGVAWVVGPEALKSNGTLLGAVAIIGAAASYAVSGAIARHVHGVSNIALTAAVLCFATALAVPASLILERPWALAPSTDSLTALVYLGTLPTAGAFLIRFFLLKRAGYSFTAMTSYLVTVFGVIYGTVLLGEDITPDMIGALALVLSGIALMRAKRRAPAKP